MGRSLTPEIPVQEIKRALPGQLSGSLVITWRCVVVETVIGSLVSIRRVIHPIRLQRRFVSRPPFGNPCVQPCVMQQERSLDLRGILSTRLPTVERNCSPKVWKPDREIVNSCSAETETDHTNLTGAFRPRFQPFRRRYKVLKHFALVDRLKKRRSFLFVAGISANRGESVRSKSEEILSAQTSSDVLDVRVEPAIFMDHEHSGQFLVRVGRTNEISADAPVSPGRRDGLITGPQPFVVLRDLLSKQVIGAKTFPDGRRGQTAEGKPLCRLQKRSTAYLAVNVTIEDVQQFLWEIGRFLSFHNRSISNTNSAGQQPRLTKLSGFLRLLFVKLPLLVFLSTVACAMAQGESAPAPELKFADLGDFKLESGATIRDCRIGYHTLGKLNDDKSNVVLWPTWFTGSSKQLIDLVGPDGYADPSRFFVILVDALGDGVSSSPSNSSVQPRMEFPVFTIRDMVNSQYRLLTENLGIKHIHAVMGISMGGMQAFQWIVSYPDFMDKAVPIVGSPRLTAYDLLLWRSEESAIEEDKDWNGGNYTTQPHLNTVAEIHNLALTTPSYRVRETAANKFPEFIDGIDKDGLGRMDANDWLRQLQAMVAHNIATPFGDSLEAAGKQVKAKVMVVASAQDHMVNPTPALELARTLHAEVVELSGDCGHLEPGCDKAEAAPKVREFLAD